MLFSMIAPDGNIPVKIYHDGGLSGFPGKPSQMDSPQRVSDRYQEKLNRSFAKKDSVEFLSLTSCSLTVG